MKSDVPLLTIVTATFNLVSAGRERRFRQCVESIHSQSCRDRIEHVIADGASTDGTAELLRDYAERGWVRVVSKRDHSVYEGMNNGLAVARGKYVLFVNSDDFLANSEGLGAALDELEASGAGYCFGDVDVLNDDDSFRAVWYGSVTGLPFAHNYCHQSMIVKTEILRSGGGFNLDYRVSSDSDVMLRLYHDNVPFIHSSHKFACYRLGGLSTAQREASRRDHAAIFFKYFGEKAGLSLDQCMGIWNYETTRGGSYDACAEILVKLPVPEWRAAWLNWMKMHFVDVRINPERRSLPRKIVITWLTGGWSGLCRAVARRLGGRRS